MSNRYEMNQKIGRLQAACVKSERRLHLAQPLRSAQVYAAVGDQIEKLTREVLNLIEQADKTRP